MSTCTIALDSANTYSFLGYGTHCPCAEAGYPLANSALDLVNGSDYSQFDSLISQLSIFPWIRRSTCGGEEYREAYDSPTNYPAKLQAKLHARMNSIATFRYIVTPVGAPSSTVRAGLSRTYNSPNAQTDFQYLLGFLGGGSGDAPWQTLTDYLARQINILMASGCHIEYFAPFNECGAANTSANFNYTYLSSAQYLQYIRSVWLGQGVTGGGLASRFPWLKLIADDPMGSYGAAAALSGAADALAAVTYYGRHTYQDGIGAGASAGYAQTEFGMFTSHWSATAPAHGQLSADVKQIAHLAHDVIVYYQAPIAIQFGSLRDVPAKAPTYTAKPMFLLNTASHTYETMPYWWCMKPYVLASGRTASTAYYSTAAYGTSANFDPWTGVYLNMFRRGDDNKYGVVYANFSGGNRTDTIAFTSGGNPIDLSGTSKTYPVLTMTTDPTPANISTTGGSYALGTVADATVILLELS